MIFMLYLKHFGDMEVSTVKVGALKLYVLMMLSEEKECEKVTKTLV